MRKQYIRRYIALMACITFAFLGTYIWFMNTADSSSTEEANAMLRVQLNEIEQRVEEQSTISVHEEVETIVKTMQIEHQENYTIWFLGLYVLTSTLFTTIFLYLYITVLHPFQKLESFAKEVAKGNLEEPLQENRMHAFGAFSWAFDNLRFELNKARENEELAIQNSKTMIATISHDIKTPIASISAYSEALAANMDTNIERRNRYLHVIQNKCSEVTNLTNDLFLHSLSDIEELQFAIVQQDLLSVCTEVFQDMRVQYGNRIQLPKNIPPVTIWTDKRRLVQALENVVSNAMKYTKKDVELTFLECSDFLQIRIQDYGEGILDDDLPLTLEKFYRGKNVKDKPGAGLGLYIVKELMEKMNGNITVENNEQGLVVVLYCKK